MRALKAAERRGADQETLRARYRALAAALEAFDEAPTGPTQLELDFSVSTGIRLDRRERLEQLGRDPDMDAPLEALPDSVKRFAELFPEGMAFSEIGWVLGTRKQQVFKIYLRAMAKLRDALASGDEHQGLLPSDVTHEVIER